MVQPPHEAYFVTLLTIALQMNRNILQLDFNMFENTLQLYDTESLLGLQDELDLVYKQ